MLWIIPWLLGALFFAYSSVQAWRAQHHVQDVRDRYRQVGESAIFEKGVREAFQQGRISRDREIEFYRLKCEGYLEEIEELKEKKGCRYA